MSKGSLRPYRAEDKPAVVEIADLAWRRINESRRKFLGEELFGVLFPNPDTRKGREMGGVCDSRPETILVYELNGRVAGFITYSLDTEKKIGTVGNNGVHPDCQGRGIAGEMYRALLERFRAAGMRFARVHTGLDEGHDPARRAYEKAGFNIRWETVQYFMKL
jgi:ribosomal protein S18 acetylase RimI-like enzyme